jgi:hypothetical protein
MALPSSALDPISSPRQKKALYAVQVAHILFTPTATPISAALGQQKQPTYVGLLYLGPATSSSPTATVPYFGQANGKQRSPLACVKQSTYL